MIRGQPAVPLPYFKITLKSLARWLSVVVMALVSVLTFAQDDPSEAAAVQTALDAANQAYLDGEFLTAHSLWRPLAEAGNAEARTNLGILARYGLGVVQDYSVALHWYQLAAEQGYARGLYQLGLMHEYGLGVGQSDSEALRWYRASAAQEYVRAQFALGVMFAEGRGVAADGVEAASWYRRAAEQGDANAQNILGRLYASGDGVTQDATAARHWFALAAQQGHADAQENLRVACAAQAPNQATSEDCR